MNINPELFSRAACSAVKFGNDAYDDAALMNALRGNAAKLE